MSRLYNQKTPLASHGSPSNHHEVPYSPAFYEGLMLPPQIAATRNSRFRPPGGIFIPGKRPQTSSRPIPTEAHFLEPPLPLIRVSSAFIRGYFSPCFVSFVVLSLLRLRHHPRYE